MGAGWGIIDSAIGCLLIMVVGTVDVPCLGEAHCYGFLCGFWILCDSWHGVQKSQICLGGRLYCLKGVLIVLRSKE
jgi:hypothetical protein